MKWNLCQFGQNLETVTGFGERGRRRRRLPLVAAMVALLLSVVVEISETCQASQPALFPVSAVRATGVQSGCTPTPISSGQVVSGSLAPTDCRSIGLGSRHFADYYSFSGQSGQRVDILITAASYDDFLILYGPLGQPLAQNDSSGGNDKAWISTRLPMDGLYVLEVTSDFSQVSGNYSFRLNTECSVMEISNGQILSGSLTDADCASLHLGTGHWADRYSFYGIANQRVDILTLAASFDDFVALYGPIGELIAQNDSSGGNDKAWISTTLPTSGVYTLEVTSDFSFVRGNYQFRLNVECAITPIHNGQTLSGSLTDADCASLRLGRGHWADRYTFRGTAGQAVELRTTASSFDDFLVLYGPIGQVVAQDDSSGGSDRARLRVTLPMSGAYIVEMTSDFSFERGNYTLQMTGGGSGCAYQLSATTDHFDAAGGSRQLTVAADANCLWTAVSNASWLHLTSGASGNGSGTVGYTVTPLVGEPRVATVTIAGQTLTVTQGEATGNHPFISAVSISGKKLFVNGGNFAEGAILLINGQRQKKTTNDESSPRTTLVAKKGGKAIAAGTTVTIEVENPDGSRSAKFIFHRP